MKNQFKETEREPSEFYNQNEDRRRLEMKRRFLLLHTRRSQLERELRTINALLLSLDKQMQHYSSCKQISLN